MKIEFPCPANSKELIVQNGKTFCTACNKDILNVDDPNISSNSCVMGDQNNDIQLDLSYSIRKFGLALMLVFGGALFNFSNAQVANELEATKKQMLEVKGHDGYLAVHVEARSGGFVHTSDPIVVLDNGDTLKHVLFEEGVYYFELLAHHAGMDAMVYCYSRGKSKRRTVQFPLEGNPEDVYFTFPKTKYRVIMGCPSF